MIPPRFAIRAVGPDGFYWATPDRYEIGLYDLEGVLLASLRRQVEPRAVTSALVDRLPGLRVLATSREPLRIRGEQVFPVAALATDVDGAAIELFRARAEAVRPGATAAVGSTRTHPAPSTQISDHAWASDCLTDK